MRYALGLFLAILGPTALTVLPGCGSNGNLGGGLPDAATPLGGAGGSTSVPTNTGGTGAPGGAAQGGNVVAGGAVQAGAVQGGNVVTGGAVQGGVVQGGNVVAGGAVLAGSSAAGGSAKGGSSGTGGSSQTSDAGIGGVTLTASVTSDGSIVPVWQNQSQVSIFLYGCGSANVWKKNGSDWVNLGTAVNCFWEGVSPEVPAGSTYSDAGPAYAVAKAWGPGTYRLQGKYGVGCTNPELGQSKAGCTAFYEAVSNEVTVVAVPDAGTGGAGGSADAGTGGVAGVALLGFTTADGHLVATWQNQSQVSIFLYGCGSADLWQKNGSDWVKLSPGFACAWEGVSPEVAPGATYTDSAFMYGPPALTLWGNGGETYRLTGKYGVGCTNPGLGQSKAGCTAFYEATSYPITLSTSSGTGGSGGSGG